MAQYQVLLILLLSISISACNSGSDNSTTQQPPSVENSNTQDNTTDDGNTDDNGTDLGNNNESSTPATDIDAVLRLRVQALGMDGDPLDGRVLPDINTSPIAQLGRELFFDTQLSGDNDVACVSCHHPQLGGADALSLPVGVGAIDPTIIGPGRRHNGNYLVDPEADGGPNVERNSPTTFNVALYDHALFYDGRVQSVELRNTTYYDNFYPSPNGSGDLIRTPDSLFNAADTQAGLNLTHAQAKFPIVSLAEMQGFNQSIGDNKDEVRQTYIQRFKNSSNWVSAFQQAYEDTTSTDEDIITLNRLTFALAEYQRSQVFVNSPWSQYLKQQSDISTEAKAGALLFYTAASEGGAGCFECHSGDFFTDEKFYNLAMPQIGRGKAAQGKDLGRYSISRNPEDTYAQRTPSLLNITTSAPYGHTGTFNTLEAAIKHHLNPLDSINEFDFGLQSLPQFSGLDISYIYAEYNTKAAYSKYIETTTPQGLTNPNITPSQVGQLVSFLETLTDPCILEATCLSPWIATNDQLKLHRLDTVVAPGFDNSAPLPTININAQPGGYGLPDLGEVPVFDPVCNSSAKDQFIGGFFFTKNLFNNGISINRSFSIEAMANTLKSVSMLNNTGSMATGDINGDCLIDLIFTQGDISPLKVYLNNGNGYSLAKQNWGLENTYVTAGITLADLNGDGWLDLFTGDLFGTEPGVFLNNGRSGFQKISHPGFKVNHATVGAAFGDIDNDGDLDAFLAHWDTDLGPEEEHLWINNGSGLFTSGARQYGLTGEFGDRDWVFTPNFADVNKDGKQDLLITADFTDTQYFIQKENTLHNLTLQGTIRDENGMGAAVADFDNDLDLDWYVTSIYDARVVSGAIAQGDTSLGWGVTGNRLYQNERLDDGSVVFNDIVPHTLSELESLSGNSNLADGGWGWGACAADFNNDGWTDIYHVNGYGFDPYQIRTDLHYLLLLFGFQDLADIYEYANIDALLEFAQSINLVLFDDAIADLKQLFALSQITKLFDTSGSAYLQDEARLFINQKDGSFKEIAASTFVNDSGQGRGVSCFDYDRDGDIDIVITNNTGDISFYENNISSTSSTTANFIDIKLLDSAPNIHAIGAKITIETSEGKQYKEVRIENNYISQNPVESHFGIGANNTLDIEIVWPDGSTQTLLNQEINKMLVIKKPL